MMLLERLRNAVSPPGSRTASFWAGWCQHVAIGMASERGVATWLGGRHHQQLDQQYDDLEDAPLLKRGVERWIDRGVLRGWHDHQQLDREDGLERAALDQQQHLAIKHALSAHSPVDVCDTCG